MKKLLLAASAAAAAMAAVPAQSAVYIGAGSALGWGPGTNEFRSDGSFGPSPVLYTLLTSLTMDAGDLLFEYVGAESEFNNTFSFTPTSLLDGVAYMTETDNYANLFGAPSMFGRGNFDDVSGTVDLAGKLNFLSPVAGPFGVGSREFGIVVDSGYVLGTALTTFYLVFDDNGALPEDNHDDMVIRVTAVPEPATWALMIAGIAAVGVSMRRRSQRVRVAFS